LPWSYSGDEAVNVRKALSYERTSALTKLAEASFFRLYMVTNGIHFRCIVSSLPISNMLA
jgi:hypothetical protein